MRKRISKILALLLLAMPVLAYQAAPAKAAMIENGKYYMANPVASGTGAITISGNTKTGGTIKGISVRYYRVPSGSTQNPTSVDWSSAPASITGAAISGINGTWTIDKTTDAGTDKYYLTNAAGTALAANAAFSFTVSGVANPGIGGTNADCPASNLDSAGNSTAGTCFAEVSLFTTEVVADMQANTNRVDYVMVGFTVTTQVTMTATVDPTLQFTVAGINSGVDIADAGATTTASETSTYSTLPFSYLTVGSPKTMGHRLYVKTNAQNGYSVKVQGTTDAADANGILKGQYAGNNIDGFGLDLGSPASFSAPAAWTSPTATTANVNTGYFGVNSNDTGTVFTGGSAGYFAPLENDTANEIMKANGPELGTLALSHIVTYALEIDVYQPADSYTGTLRYTCTPQY